MQRASAPPCSYGTRTQYQLVARARFLTCPKNAPFRDVTTEVCIGDGTPPKLNIPKRCRGKRFSRSGCPKRAVTGNGRARGRACGARAPRGATSKPLCNPHVAPPTTLRDVTGASRGPLVRMTRYGMASGGRKRPRVTSFAGSQVSESQIYIVLCVR